MLARRSRRAWTAALVLVGSSVVSFQGGLVRVAAPVIRADLGAGIPAMQAVGLAALVVTTSTVVAFGRLADLIGPRRVYAAGLACFAAGSALSGAAPSTGWLVAAQAVNGAGWSMVLASGTPLLVGAFATEERGRVVAASHMAVALGLAAGPGLGGVLVRQAGWRAALIAIVPVALVLGALVAARLPGDAASGPRRRFDVGGSVALAVALGTLVVALDTRERRAAGASGLVALAVVSAGALLVFLALEARAREPMVDLGLFRRRAFSAGLAASFLTFVAMASNMFLLPFYLQEVLGRDVAAAGLVLMVMPAGILLSAPVAGWSADRFGSRVPATSGMLLVAVAIVLMAGFGTRVPTWRLVAVLLVYGAGAGLFQSPNISGVLGAAPADRLGVASGTLSTVGRLGQVVGVTLAGGIWDRGVRVHGADVGGSVLAFRQAFGVLAVFAVLSAVASWSRGPRPANEPDLPADLSVPRHP